MLSFKDFMMLIANLKKVNEHKEKKNWEQKMRKYFKRIARKKRRKNGYYKRVA